MSYKDKAITLIMRTVQPLINYQIGLVANRIANAPVMGTIMTLNTNGDGSVTDATILMADGTIVKNCQLSGSRPMGVGSSVVNLNGILF